MELSDGRARWRQVHEIITGRIRSGQYPPGSRIPSLLQMQQEWGIATATGQKVMRQLRADGTIRTEPGMGSYVVDELPEA